MTDKSWKKSPLPDFFVKRNRTDYKKVEELLNNFEEIKLTLIPNIFITKPYW